MKRVLKILAGLGLIMSASAGSAQPVLTIDYIITYYADGSFSGEPVGRYIFYCDWSVTGGGYPTAYSIYEPVGPC
jgi:hypothetical protein